MAYPINHIELQIQDVKKSMKWYGDLFGWETNYMEEMKYGTFYDGRVGGGFNAPAEGMHGTVPYVEVGDVTAILQKAENTGGKIITSESPIPGVGTFGIFTDPDNNMIGVVHSTNQQQMPKSEKPNQIVHIELQVKDAQNAANWYSDLFGWETRYDNNLNYGLFTTGENEVAGGFNPTESPHPGAVAYVHVADVDAMTKKAESHGAKVVQQPFDIEGAGMRMALVADPDGVVLGLMKSN